MNTPNLVADDGRKRPSQIQLSKARMGVKVCGLGETHLIMNTGPKETVHELHAADIVRDELSGGFPRLALPMRRIGRLWLSCGGIFRQ